MSEVIPCQNGHTFNGITPIVDENIMQIQNHDLLYHVCDCKKMIYSEGACGCAVKHWEIKLLENK
jgi:hypothetical protein